MKKHDFLSFFHVFGDFLLCTPIEKTNRSLDFITFSLNLLTYTHAKKSNRIVSQSSMQILLTLNQIKLIKTSFFEQHFFWYFFGQKHEKRREMENTKNTK